MISFVITLIGVLALVGCVEHATEPSPDAGADASTLTSCEQIELDTEDAPDVGEVLVEGRVITPGVSFSCDGGATTWSQYARRRAGVLGTYGRTIMGSTRCEWRDAIDQRTPATGGCR